MKENELYKQASPRDLNQRSNMNRYTFWALVEQGFGGNRRARIYGLIVVTVVVILCVEP